MAVSQFKTFIFAMALSGVANAACEFFPNLEVPIALNNPNRLTCLRDSHFLLPIPAKKSIEEIVKGPKTDEAELVPQSEVFCRYFYRYQNGSSNKFRCLRTTKENVLQNDKGEPVPQAVGHADKMIDGKLEEDVLVDKAGNAITYTNKKGEIKPMIADVLKVRFKASYAGMKNMTDTTEKRHREAYTSAVASRMAWMMGFPAEYAFPVKQVTCYGCKANPWNEGTAPQLQPANETHVFPGVSIERKFDGKRIIKAYTSPKDPKTGKAWENVPWRWDEYISNFKKLNSVQKHELQVLALFINLLHTVEERGSQHLLVCPKEAIVKDEATGKKVCASPLAATHDIGSAFGNRTQKLLTGNHPRGDYAAYKALNMFVDSNKCILTAQPGVGPNKNLPITLKSVTEKARVEFVQRLDLISKSDLFTIMQISNFQDVDMIFKKAVAQKTGLQNDALNDKVNELWADLIYSKMDQFRTAQCPNQDPL